MERLIIIHWDKSIGPEPIIQYPPQKEFPNKELILKIWAIHELDKENSMIELVPEEGGMQYFSILQYFEGEIYFLLLVYEQDNKVENVINEYPDILAIICKNLIGLINTEKLPRAISEAYNTITNFDILEEEDILIGFFKDRIKNTILKILRNGVISKSKLTEVLRNDYGFSTVNIDLLLVAFLREGLITKENLPGVKDCYFLINDLSCMRIPPKQIPDSMNKSDVDSDVVISYNENFIKYYLNYDCDSKIDNKSAIKYLMDKDVSHLLKVLREESISVRQCLNILNNRNDLFNELIEDNYIFEAKGMVFIFSDIRFVRFRPHYIIKKLQKRYEKKEICLDEYITHLKILTDTMKAKSKISYEIL